MGCVLDLQLVAHQGHCVQWTTPLGLPVVQPYTRGHKRKQVRTTFACITLPDVYDTRGSQVRARKVLGVPLVAALRQLTGVPSWELTGVPSWQLTGVPSWQLTVVPSWQQSS